MVVVTVFLSLPTPLLSSLDLRRQRLGGAGVGGVVVGAPGAVHLPALPHHALGGAVGALCAVRGLSHGIVTAGAAALARHSAPRAVAGAVVVPVVGGLEGVVGGAPPLVGGLGVGVGGAVEGGGTVRGAGLRGGVGGPSAHVGGTAVCRCVVGLQDDGDVRRVLGDVRRVGPIGGRKAGKKR